MKFVKFRTFDDFVKFAAVSQIPFIHHTAIKGKQVYFIHMSFFEGMVYYFDQDELIKEKYVLYNRFRDQVSFSDKFDVDPQKVNMPIFEVEETNIFSEYPPK